MCVVTVVEVMVVGAGQRDGERARESERASGDGGGVCLFLLCYFAPPERTVATKRWRERDDDDDEGLRVSMSGSKGKVGDRGKRREDGQTDRG